jgi:L-threonylcarbamoyladenylate synthase
VPSTLHLHAQLPADLARAAEILRAGGLVAFPTETVYGLGANAFSPQAVAAIFAAKGRPAWDPVIVHLASANTLDLVAFAPDALAARVRALAATFWPGPLTLLLPRTAALGDAVTAGRPLVGVRVPAHPVAQALLAAAGVPVAAPSANRFGHTSPTTAAHVLADLDGCIEAILDGGPTTIGVESTVLDPTRTPMVLYRPGAVTPGDITAATGIPVELYVAPERTSEAPSSLPSPGVGIRHYAPRATLILIEPSPTKPAHSLLARARDELAAGRSLGLLLPEGWAAPPDAQIVSWGTWDNPEILAARLFLGLRDLDSRGVDTILAPLPAPGGLRDALRDRLLKAARPPEAALPDPE